MKLQELFEAKERSILSLFGKQKDHIKGNFYSVGDELTSLEGAPTRVDRYFSCAKNKLTSLDFAPSYIGEDFFCYENKLKSLHNIHKIIKHIGGDANFEDNPIKSHILGLLLIDGLQRVYFDYGRCSKYYQ